MSFCLLNMEQKIKKKKGLAEPCTDPRAHSSFSFYCRKALGKSCFVYFAVS